MMIASELGDGVDVNEAEHARVRRQLDRVLAHASFRNSRRCQSFLRYVVEEKLHGNAAHLKERMIGIAVFHQPLDYDTNANSAVRVTAGEVRRRLAQYYVEPAAEDEIVIELPLGSYVPDFHPRLAAAVREVAVAIEPTVIPEVVLSASPAELLSQNSELTQPRYQLAVAVTQFPNWSTRNVVALVLLLVCAAVLGAVLKTSTGNVLAASESDLIWRGAFNGANVMLCTGTLDSGPAPTDGSPRQQRLGISVTSARTATIISAAIGHAGGSASLLSVQDTKVEDLQHAPAVLLGAFNNQWTMRLQAPLRYQFVSGENGAPNAIVDTTNPSAAHLGTGDTTKHDYGVFAHFTSPVTGQSTVIAGGLAMHGTAAVRIFLSSPELLKDFSKSAPTGWEKGNYEIVLASDQVNGLADPPKVVATYFW